MNQYQRISDLKRSKGKGGELARYLLSLEGPEWNEWERRFLEDRVFFGAKGEQVTTRQAEQLLDLENMAKPVRTIGQGFSVKILITKCHEARTDLDEELCDFIERLHGAGAETVTRRQGNYLLSCARQLNILEA